MSVGLVLGKFMPPHAGHLHLISVARALCDELAIVVGTQPSEPISGALRFGWMRTLCPEDRVVHLHRQLPQLPEQDPGFWPLWVEALTEVLVRAWVRELRRVGFECSALGEVGPCCSSHRTHAHI